jgi:glycosyltransferase involved in cell wall biosynthesis
VTGGSPDELAAALRKLLGEPQRRAEMGACGVRATRARLSWNAVAAQVEDLYRELLKGNVQSAAVEPA